MISGLILHRHCSNENDNEDDVSSNEDNSHINWIVSVRFQLQVLALAELPL